MINYKSPPVGQEISCVMKYSKSALIERKRFNNLIKKILEKENFQILNFNYYEFKENAFTTFVLLGESHLAIHTYPEYSSIYFNMYSCRGPNDAKKTFEKIRDYLKPSKILFFKENKVNIENNI